MAASLILGVDVGVSGAIAFLSADGDLLAVEDMPVDVVQVGKGKRSRVAIPRLIAILKGASGAHAFVEQPTYRPMTRPDAQTGIQTVSRMGVAGAGAFGESYGCVITALVACGCALTEVRPGVWGRGIGLKGGKDDSRRFAGNLFPSQSRLFARVKDDGRSDSALIGYWGLRQLSGAGREST